jgi:pyruvate ferredoxin oxidoreductase gamma subunit
MLRIRFHGRGGQGMKSAANLLGDALFASGCEVQDAPRYGAERRGAPMAAYVRAASHVIVERGAIVRPDLVVVADPTLIGIAAAGVMQGVSARSTLFVNTSESEASLRERLAFPGRIVTWPPGASLPVGAGASIVSPACAGAAARLLGVVGREALAQAISAHGANRSDESNQRSLAHGLGAYDALAAHAGCVEPQPKDAFPDHPGDPDWVVLEAEDADLSAPDIFEPATSVQANTGTWRSFRPVIDDTLCNRCSWICSTLCPDSAIRVAEDRRPIIDYDHCKGCMICVMACPPHAIRQVAESDAQPARSGA